MKASYFKNTTTILATYLIRNIYKVQFAISIVLNLGRLALTFVYSLLLALNPFC